MCLKHLKIINAIIRFLKNSNLNFQRLNNLQYKEIVFSESFFFCLFFCRDITLLNHFS